MKLLSEQLIWSVILPRKWLAKMEARRPPGDPTPRGQVFERLVETMITNKLIVEGCRGDETAPFRDQALDGLATVRDEARLFGFDADLLNIVAGDRIQRMKEEALDKQF